MKRQISTPDQRAVTRPRTTVFGRQAHLTGSALASVLAEVREHGLPDHMSRRTIQRDRQRIVQADTPFGPLLQWQRCHTKSGQILELPVQHPFAFLWQAASTIETFKSHLISVLNANKNQLNLIMYCDEINAGRVTADVKTREIQAVYWSIKEFGPAVLCNDDAWFVIMTARSQVIESLEGGMAQAFKVCYRLLDEALRNGVEMKLGQDEQRLLHGRVSMVVQDERAHKAVFALKGASGTKFCANCMRYVLPKSTILPDRTGTYISGDCLPLQRDQLCTNAYIQAINTRVAEVAATGSQTELSEVCTNLGFNYVPESVRQDPTFNLIDTMIWDWMHCYFVGGVFDKEMEELFRLLKLKKALDSKDFYNYCALFEWPKAYAAGNKVCQPNFKESNYEPSGTASELLSVAPVLATWLRRLVKPTAPRTLDAAITSMLALCDVVDVLLLAMRGRCLPSTLDTAINTHLQLRKIAYEDKLWRPKAHYVLHLAAQLERHGFLPACFVQERKHRMVKRGARGRHNSTAFDRGVLEEMTLQHLHDLQSPLTQEALRDTHDAPNRLKEALVRNGDVRADDTVLVGRQAVVSSRAISVGDVALVSLEDGHGFGQVVFHFSVQGEVRTCIALWEIISTNAHETICYRRDETIIIPTSSLIESCIFSKAAVDEKSHILLPVSGKYCLPSRT